MNKIGIVLFLLVFMAFGPQSLVHAEGSVETGLSDQALEAELSQAIDLDRIQHAVNVVRETATAEELKQIDLFQSELNQIKAEQAEPGRKQTKAGRLFSRLGLAVNRVMVTTLRPFIYGSAYLTARLERKKHLSEDSGNPVKDFFSKLANRLKDAGEAQAAALADRIVRGDQLNATEIQLLVEAFPRLDARVWELFGTEFGVIVSTSVVDKIFLVAGLGTPVSSLYTVGVFAWFGAVIPCLGGDGSDYANPNRQAYCEELVNYGYSRFMTSRIRGYLRGVQDRNRNRD